MLDFSSDYTRGCHPEILEQLAAANECDFPGYGQDDLCSQAKQAICGICGLDDAQVFFLVGGTQTNQIATKAILESWQGVVAADTGHVAVHEAGAIEHAGRKVITIAGHDGKICADELDACLRAYRLDCNRDHMVEPGMVYISQPTEYGTVYNLSELEAISHVCRSFEIPLYIDGARLGYALAAKGADVALEDIARLSDAFYIGGTKLGALFGEALVFPRMRFPKLLSLVKQSGGLLAKGWLIGLQFRALLGARGATDVLAPCGATDVLEPSGANVVPAVSGSRVAIESPELAGPSKSPESSASPASHFGDSLYMEGARNAIERAGEIRDALVSRGYELAVNSPTNQQFIIVDDATLERLDGKVRYGFWENLPDGRTVIRFATSWHTSREDVRRLLDII